MCYNGGISNQFQRNCPGSFAGELLFSNLYLWMQLSRNYLYLDDLFRTQQWNRSLWGCTEAACVVCLHTFQSKRKWMGACVISAGLHILSRQSIPIKASCSPGDCRGGRAPLDQITLWKQPRLADCGWKGTRGLSGVSEEVGVLAGLLCLSPKSSKRQRLRVEAV